MNRDWPADDGERLMGVVTALVLLLVLVGALSAALLLSDHEAATAVVAGQAWT